jgi:hypothetical protein
LVQRIGHDARLEEMCQQFQSECDIVRQYRNKLVGHKDLSRVLNSKDNPLPGIARTRIEKILERAAQTLNEIYRQVVPDREIGFRPLMFGCGRSLVHCLKVAKRYHAEKLQRRTSRCSSPRGDLALLGFVTRSVPAAAELHRP